jgi:hypothetical protein
VTAFGTTGNGKSDDTKAIQAALDACAKMGGYDMTAVEMCSSTCTCTPGTQDTGKLSWR